MEEQLLDVEETFLVFNHNVTANNKFGKIELLTHNYRLAELYANRMAIKNDTAYTICKYYPVDIENLEISPYVQVRMSYNKDYDEYNVLSLKERDKAKYDSIIISDDDESVSMCKVYLKYDGDTYDSIIEKAKKKVQDLIKNNK